MVNVKMLAFWQGSAWPTPLFEGLVYELPKELADHLIATGRAELVKAKKETKPRGRPKASK